MKSIFRSSILLVLSIVLIGCNDNASSPKNRTNPSNGSTSPRPKNGAEGSEDMKPNPFEEISFPQATCGDSLPDDPDAYPVNFYPVFVEYSEEKLKTLRAQYCQDAFQTIRKSNDLESIQVASFVDLDKANNFKDFLDRRVGQASVGKPSIIQAEAEEDDNEPTEASNSPSPTPSSPSPRPRKSQSEFTAVDFDCSEAKKFKDLEFVSCFANNINAKNYSSDWYEVRSDSTHWTLVPPGDRVGILRSSKLLVKKYEDLPTKDIDVICSGDETNIWGLTISPRCNSKGTYIDLESQAYLSYTLIVELPDGDVLSFEDSIIGKRAWIESTARTVDFTLKVR